MSTNFKKINRIRETWLAQSVDYVILDLESHEFQGHTGVRVYLNKKKTKKPVINF